MRGGGRCRRRGSLSFSAAAFKGRLDMKKLGLSWTVSVFVKKREPV